MRFVIPLPPNRANARGHWSKHHREKKAYWAELDALQLLGERDGFGVPRPPRWPLPKAKADATLYVWAKMDEFNAGNRLKWVEDWLVTRGYIVNDTSDVLRWDGIPRQEIDRKRQRIVLTLELAA